MVEKIIRDPVHDVIAFELDRPLDALLFDLVNTPEFQRLRRIRQLGMASLAYPGADHSRYSHSLGAMETARKMLAHAAPRTSGGDLGRLDSDAAVCVIGALLHDLGHGPFSHVFERVSGQAHENLTRWIIENPDSQVNAVLAKRDAQLPRRIASFLNPDQPRTVFTDIITSQLDADRFDYLLRDNLHTGSRYGDFDLGWLLHHLGGGDSGKRLLVTAKGVSAVEAYLQARYHMYRNVYFHKVVRSAEGMIRLALQRAKRLAMQDRLPWPPRSDPAIKALLGQQLSIAEFADLDDVSVQSCLKVWARFEDAVLAGLCRGLLERRLFKSIDLGGIQDPVHLARVMELAQKAVADAGGDQAYDLFYDEPADTPYEVYDGAGESGDILVETSPGRLVSLAQISPMPRMLGTQLKFRRLHVSPGHRAAVLRVVETVGRT